jgi:hypothetical protein
LLGKINFTGNVHISINSVNDCRVTAITGGSITISVTPITAGDRQLDIRVSCTYRPSHNRVDDDATAISTRSCLGDRGPAIATAYLDLRISASV